MLRFTVYTQTSQLLNYRHIILYMHNGMASNPDLISVNQRNYIVVDSQWQSQNSLSVF